MKTSKLSGVSSGKQTSQSLSPFKRVARIARAAYDVDTTSTLVIAISSIIIGVAPGLQVYFTAVIANALVLYATTDTGSLNVYSSVAALVAITILIQAVSLAQMRSITRCQSRMSESLGSQVLGKCLELSQEEIEDADTHDSIQRAIREMAFRPGMLLSDSAQIITHTVTLLSIGTVLASLSPMVAILAILAPAPTVYAQITQGTRTHKLEYGRSEDRRRLSYWHHLASEPTTSHEIRVHSLQKSVGARYSKVVSRIVTGDLMLANANFRFMLPAILITGCIGAVAQLLAISTVDRGPAMVAAVIAVFQALGFLQNSMQQVFTSIADLNMSQKFVSNILEFIDRPLKASKSGEHQVTLPIEIGLTFHNVSFRYANTNTMSLHEVSLVLRPSEITAIVGVNGSGKSTIAKLLGRLYEPTTGTIYLDNIPLNSYDLDNYRSNVGIVFQDFVKYQLPVRDNVRLDECASMNTGGDVALALNTVGLSEFVETLPDGQDTVVGRAFGGTDLSGGQWQRLAAARALVRDPAVLVLDEPTAAVDTVAEHLLIQALKANRQNRITVLIAHKASLVRQADRIVVLKDGHLVGDGTHYDLIETCDAYGALFGTPADLLATTEAER